MRHTPQLSVKTRGGGGGRVGGGSGRGSGGVRPGVRGGGGGSGWGSGGGPTRVSGIWYLVDPPEAPTQPEGFPENVGHPTATWRLTRSRQGGSKRAAHARTLRHQGLTPAVVLGVWGGGAPLDWGSGWVPRALSGSRRGGASQGKGLRRGAD